MNGKLAALLSQPGSQAPAWEPTGRKLRLVADEAEVRGNAVPSWSLGPSEKLAALLLAMATIVGCGTGESVDSGGGQPGGPTAGQSNLPPPPPVAQPAARPAEPKPDVVRRQAKPGVGVKGKGYGEGFVATPIKAYFSVRERMAFNRIIHSMKLFQAQHDRFPQTHEEFIKEIIEPSHIELPKLRRGQRFVYDPKQVKLPDNPGLMVESPK